MPLTISSIDCYYIDVRTGELLRNDAPFKFLNFFSLEEIEKLREVTRAACEKALDNANKENLRELTSKLS